MTQSFFSMLETRARQIDSLLCVGLDPHPDECSEPGAAGVRSFCLRMIQATADLALAYKLNIAFFEALGSEGLAALENVIRAIPKGIPVVIDAKRGDISSTARAYVNAIFHHLGADAVTVNPYLGYDSVQPFLCCPGKGVFLLCKTSNPGSVDLQDLPLASGNAPYRLFEKVALMAQEWNVDNNIGLVVGATQPTALRRLRLLTPDLWFLAPGIGAQGADLHEALQAGLRSDGLGMLVPVSRGISRAADPHQAALELVQAMRAEQATRRARTALTAGEMPELFAHLADGLLQVGCIRFGKFTLKSGLVSPIYIDLRQIITLPSLLAEVSTAYVPVLRELEFDRIAALPYAALPIATAISLQTGWPFIYPRKEMKGYGTRAEIEGHYHEGEQVVIVDDLATTGGSKFEIIQKLTAAGLKVKDVVVLIDRQSGAAQALADAGYTLRSVFTLTGLLDYWEKTARIPAEQIGEVREFLLQTQ
jgi:uridine monophosphate synthetase